MFDRIIKKKKDDTSRDAERGGSAALPQGAQPRCQRTSAGGMRAAGRSDQIRSDQHTYIYIHIHTPEAALPALHTPLIPGGEINSPKKKKKRER